MSHFGDFMDGVPVKISEKYKRPPRIDLPYSVHDCPQRAQSVVDNAKYCSTFETKVLSKLQELRSAKEIKKNERRHRLQLLQEAKQNKLDAIAAVEAEEKLKQLSVSDVSYPSTEEISAISPDEKVDRDCDTTPSQEEVPDPKALGGPEAMFPMCTNPDLAPNILQPIQIQSNYPQNSLLDDPDPLQEIKYNAKLSKILQYNHNVETLTFKDFENDTSSPFDNVELKTINDMELLSQILQSQRESTTSFPQQYVPEQNYVAIPNCASQAQIEGLTYLPNTYNEQPLQGPGLMYGPHQHYPNSNGYYVPTDNACDSQTPLENINMYMPNYQYYVPANQYPVDPAYYSNQLTVGSNANQPQEDSSYIPQPYYFHYPHMSQVPATTELPAQEQGTSSCSQNVKKSRSRSVPDIMKELNEELVSAQLRANERSFNASPAPTYIPQASSSCEKKAERRRKTKPGQLPNPYEKLSSRLQDMCQKIHSMGFPLDRVARVCTLVGDSDKKVIEALLILGELMDLGFSEELVSAALVKHEFNRDKALDELVS